ncbi:hypothetical protein GMRT_14527 [Giardia muris]|uniref:B30.2/SPRY domain-containing protein n=1 Tax=Giardia muris TaxID=5742 RepID=A0A4Z1T974_GIAMU|nr:hypothetical protein GMRT_14527 [Giardia muris]|eukprot:TNJ29079.1 hypothetical protein GMRT_14527 [Giardia muris]
MFSPIGSPIDESPKVAQNAGPRAFDGLSLLLSSVSALNYPLPIISQHHQQQATQRTMLLRLMAAYGIRQPRISFDCTIRWCIPETYDALFSCSSGRTLVRSYDTNTQVQGLQPNFIQSLTFTNTALTAGCHVLRFKLCESLASNVIIGVCGYEAMLRLQQLQFDPLSGRVDEPTFTSYNLRTGEIIADGRCCQRGSAVPPGSSLYCVLDMDKSHVWCSVDGLEYVLAGHAPRPAVFFAQLFDEGDVLSIEPVPAA